MAGRKGCRGGELWQEQEQGGGAFARAAGLQRLELEREARPQLLQRRLDLSAPLVLLEDVAVVSEEDEVALVVQGHHLLRKRVSGQGEG